MPLIENRSGTSKLINLFGEFPEVNTPLMIHTNVIKKSSIEFVFPKRHGKVRIFADAHLRKTSYSIKGRLPHTHIETAWLEAAYRLLRTADSACCKDRRHGIGNGFLHQIKALMSLIGTAKGVTFGGNYIAFNVSDIILLHNDVRIYKNQPVIFIVRGSYSSGTVIPGESGSRVIFPEEFNIQFFSEQVNRGPKVQQRAIIHNHHLKIGIRLQGQGIQQLVKFFLTVVDGDDDRNVYQCCQYSLRLLAGQFMDLFGTFVHLELQESAFQFPVIEF